jgi:pimeloyl-ACP methyl ester carboxylesterase
VSDPADPKVVTRSREERDHATVTDLAFGDGEMAVDAYLVEPEGGGTGSAVLYLHWFDTEAPDGNRTQFVDEAVMLAGSGVVSLHPQGAFPWNGDPTDSAGDMERIRDGLARHRAGLDLLAARPDVERIAVVAHDFGAMYAALLASEDRRPVAHVLIAGTPRWADWFLTFWKIDEDRSDYQRAMAPLDPIAHVGSAAPAELLFQFGRNDFYIARMTAREFAGAASEPSSLLFYDADHDMRHPQARIDRVEFLARTLGFDPGTDAA